jgi:hypothetical protein
MKRIFVLFTGVLLTVCKLQADPSVDWISDSYGSVDVIISGTGLDGTIYYGSSFLNESLATSPSGLWLVSASVGFAYPTSFKDVNGNAMLDLSNAGGLAFLGQLPAQYPVTPLNGFNGQYGSGASLWNGSGYLDAFAPVAPVNDGNLLETQNSQFPLPGWTGNSTVSITSIPNLNDLSTWTWTEELYASGPGLGVIPEPSTVSLGALAAILGLAGKLYSRRETMLCRLAPAASKPKGKHLGAGR